MNALTAKHLVVTGGAGFLDDDETKRLRNATAR